ncbi:MAG TPA: hypothetical protein DDW50_13460 [Firmicutes bacterium]|jgi:hypothetical protein|nr:hypothetical protein [Bacillota bacterium]
MSNNNTHRDVFKLEGNNHSIRFGARFIESDGLEEKWTGEIPEIPEIEKDQLIGQIITNSEGKEYKLNRIIEGNSEDDHHVHQKYLWIESIKSDGKMILENSNLQ